MRVVAGETPGRWRVFVNGVELDRIAIADEGARYVVQYLTHPGGGYVIEDGELKSIRITGTVRVEPWALRDTAT